MSERRPQGRIQPEDVLEGASTYSRKDPQMSRRGFLKLGTGVVAGLLASSCMGEESEASSTQKAELPMNSTATSPATSTSEIVPMRDGATTPDSTHEEDSAEFVEPTPFPTAPETFSTEEPELRVASSEIPQNALEIDTGRAWYADQYYPSEIDTVVGQIEQTYAQEGLREGIATGIVDKGTFFLKGDDEEIYAVPVYERGVYHEVDGEVYRKLAIRDIANGKIQLDTANEVFYHLNSKQQEALASIQVAGENMIGNDAPTLTALRDRLTINGAENYDEDQRGKYARKNIARDGRVEVISEAELPTMGAEIGVGGEVDPSIVDKSLIVDYQNGHNVTQGMKDFMNNVYKNRALEILGLPISDPYWMKLRIGGKLRNVQWQAFERGTVTFNPANPEEWEYEGGLVGNYFEQVLKAEAEEIHDPEPTPEPEPEPTTLREHADMIGFSIGTEFNYQQWVDGGKYREIVEEEFNINTVDYGIHWFESEPTEGVFDLSAAKNQITILKDLDSRVRVHPLVWQEGWNLPDWLKEGVENGAIGRERMKQILENHVVKLVSELKDDVDEFVVVNEPYLEGHPIRSHDIFYRAYGNSYDYIVDAFRAARDVAPEAVLIYNDTLNHGSYGDRGVTTQLTKDNLQLLRDTGLIDENFRLGCQMHERGDLPYDKEDTSSTLEGYGVPIVFSELDVDMSNVPGSSEEREAIQAQRYGEVFDTAFNSDLVKGVVVWGVGDKYNWLERDLGKQNADPTIYDDGLNRKKAYYSVESQFKEELS